MWFYNGLNMLHALRRANPQQSNDQGETESISYQAWRVFVTIWNFLLLAGWMKNPTEETSSLRRHAKETFREWLCLILVCIAALKKFYTRSTQCFTLQAGGAGESLSQYQMIRT